MFAARPLTSRLETSETRLWYENTEENQSTARDGRMQSLLSAAPDAETGPNARTSAPDNHTGHEAAVVQGEHAPVDESEHGPKPWWLETRLPFLFPPSQFPLNLPPPMALTPLPTLQRWKWRLNDLSQLRAHVEYDMHDKVTYPELEWDAKVRCSAQLHPEEQSFIAKRLRHISSEGTDALATFLRLPQGTYVHPDDVPRIAIGGSGGGYRAIYGFAGFIKEAESTGLWPCATWVSGVSGSCWTVAAYYNIAKCSSDVLISHLMAMANEETHPMSLHAMNRIARSANGIYYLLGPIMRKARNRPASCRIMDFYATLIHSYQFLPRPLALLGTKFSYNGPHARQDTERNAPYEPFEGLSRETFQWSKTWKRAGLDEGKQPMPIITGVRRVWRPRPKKLREVVPKQSPLPTKSAEDAKEEDPIIDVPKIKEISPYGSGYDWYEISPLEFGSRSIGAWIPTWAYGRRFENGSSTQRLPETNLSMIMGQCTGAPAGPISAYIATMLASIPQGTAMSAILGWVNSFVQLKQWEKRWGNPIRAADEPNPFYGYGMDNVVVDMPPHEEDKGPGFVTEASVQERPPSIVDQPYATPLLTREDQPSANIPDAVSGTSNSISAAPVSTQPAGLAEHDTRYLDTFVSKLPHLEMPTLPRFQRRRSNSSIDSNLSDMDPNTFMAPMDERAEAPEHRNDANDDERPQDAQKQHSWNWEHSRRLRLMDSGLSNNLPNHILSCEERKPDVLISFDTSSDIKLGEAKKRLFEFAAECNFEMEMNKDTVADLLQASKAAAHYKNEQSDTAEDWAQESERVRSVFEPQTAQRFGLWRAKNGPKEGRDPDVELVYCPLFPNAVQPGFDPTSTTWSTSYNLIWTADQVCALLRTAAANVEDNSKGIHTIRAAVRDAYERRRAARLAREALGAEP